MQLCLDANAASVMETLFIYSSFQKLLNETANKYSICYIRVFESLKDMLVGKVISSSAVTKAIAIQSIAVELMNYSFVSLRKEV